MLIEERQKAIILVGEFAGIRSIHKIPKIKIQSAV